MKPTSFEFQIDSLRSRLQKELPGLKAHLTMAPGLRKSPDILSISKKPCRTAAVLAVLYPHQDSSVGILLTKRREDLQEHAGQISFPGGRQEQGESLQQAALRETEEEIGLPPENISIIGELSPIYIDVSNFCVHPFVGFLNHPPSSFTIQEEEVQKVLELSITELTSPENKRSENRVLRGYTVDVPFFYVSQEIVWGATAMILAELLMVLEG
ncbi:MAG: CoA pyrophosphatase [Rhodothermaceae bacterium]|nr:CoA pyrophosphatase [Rhodothermaceae bacterium]